MMLAPLLLAQLVAAAPSQAQEAGTLAERLSTANGVLLDWIGNEFERSPAIVLGVGLALAMMPLAVLGLFIRRTQRNAQPADVTHPKSIPISGWKARGLLVVANSRGEVHEVGHGLVRIGREEDNDVQLAEKTVHRYHAIVERTPDAEFYVTDVSGADGNGVRVDGQKIERERLRGGELIEVGRARLRFQLTQAGD
jgi:hypothetical protein